MRRFGIKYIGEVLIAYVTLLSKGISGIKIANKHLDFFIRVIAEPVPLSTLHDVGSAFFN